MNVKIKMKQLKLSTFILVILITGQNALGTTISSFDDVNYFMYVCCESTFMILLNRVLECPLIELNYDLSYEDELVLVLNRKTQEFRN